MVRQKATWRDEGEAHMIVAKPVRDRLAREHGRWNEPLTEALERLMDEYDALKAEKQDHMGKAAASR